MAATEAVLGAMGSAGACLISNPIDVARVRLQLCGRGLPRVKASWTSGLSAAMAYNVTFNGARFYMFESFSSSLPTPIAGFVAGLVAGFISSPLAKARTLQQSGERLSVLEAVSARPFAGAGAWAARNGGHTTVIFTVYNSARGRLRTALPTLPTSWVYLLASLQAATISCVVMNPIDVVATRIFHQESSAARGSPAAYRGALDCALQTLRGEGLRGLYRGLGANLLRIAPHTTLTFGIVEALRSWRGSAFWRALHHTRGSV